MDTPLSEFELRRLENIKRNNKFLISLGLPPQHLPQYPKRVKTIATKINKNKSYKLTEDKGSSSESSDDSDEDYAPGTRYPKRPRATKVCYSEAEVPDDDLFLFCEDCQELHYGDCPTHGPLNVIADSTSTATTLTAARASLPNGLEIKNSSIPNAGLGGFAKTTIPTRSKLGPYQGRKVKRDDEQMDKDTSYMWEIIKDGKLSHFVDGQDETESNWMRFVNCPRCEDEQNLVAFQYRGQIFYRTYKEIRPGTELLVWYGDKYAEELGISLENEIDDVSHTEGSTSSTIPDHQCKKCSKCFTSSNMLLRHRKYKCYIAPTGDELKCKLCQLQCKTAKSLNEHVVDIHCSRTSNNMCPLCNKVFTTRRNLIRHIRTHTGYQPYKCNECGKGFNRYSNLKTHMLTHTGEKPYQCKYCDKGFAQSGVLTKHMRTHTGEKPYQCKYCDQGFARSGNLTRHMRTHTGEKPYQCKYCDKGFAHSGDLTRHMRTHTGDKPYQCKYCDKGFAHSGDLTRHMRTHTGDKPYQCKYCDKGFAHSGDLTRHMRTHTGEKPYQCKYCDKGFAHSGILTRHMRTHTGEKPYQCKYCDKGFAHSGDLTRHMRTHTDEDEEKSYQTKYCDQGALA